MVRNGGKLVSNRYLIALGRIEFWEQSIDRLVLAIAVCS